MAQRRNLALLLQYDGSDFHGWQVQPELRTVQGVLEEALLKLFGERVSVAASGRTDAGVHALGQVAGFTLAHEIPADRLPAALNGVLPDDVSVSAAADVAPHFHPRFSADGKIYRYYIFNSPVRSAVYRRYTAHLPFALDLRAMEEACLHLVGRQDFASFMSSGSPVESTVRSLNTLTLRRRSRTIIELTAAADGFLYQMVRNIAGTLIDVGRGRTPAGAIPEMLQGRDRRLAGPAAPPEGLWLVRVHYPEGMLRWKSRRPFTARDNSIKI